MGATSSTSVQPVGASTPASQEPGLTTETTQTTLSVPVGAEPATAPSFAPSAVTPIEIPPKSPSFMGRSSSFRRTPSFTNRGSPSLTTDAVMVGSPSHAAATLPPPLSSPSRGSASPSFRAGSPAFGTGDSSPVHYVAVVATRSSGAVSPAKILTSSADAVAFESTASSPKARARPTLSVKTDATQPTPAPLYSLGRKTPSFKTNRPPSYSVDAPVSPARRNALQTSWSDTSKSTAITDATMNVESFESDDEDVIVDHRRYNRDRSRTVDVYPPPHRRPLSPLTP